MRVIVIGGVLIGASRPKVKYALTTLEDVGGIARAGARLACHTEVREHCRHGGRMLK
jgi:hypothetical protein